MEEADEVVDATEELASVELEEVVEEGSAGGNPKSGARFRIMRP